MTVKSNEVLPKAFVWRRVQSIAGLWIVIFLIEHLLVNSQAALFIGANGSGFVESVNAIHSWPYLPVVEMLLLGVPIAIHAVWGVVYLRSSKHNCFPTDGSTPSLPEYPRNNAYTWQRITSWILLIGIVAHVIHMRFIEYPTSAQQGSTQNYMIRLQQDEGLYTLAERLNFTIYSPEQIQDLQSTPLKLEKSEIENVKIQHLLEQQQEKQHAHWLQALKKRPLESNQVMAVAKDFGTAELLMVRDTFKMPIMLVLYTLLVMSACFHAFNGLWTFLISWGVTLSPMSQQWSRHVATGLMIVVGFLGLAAIWGTYWLNLKS